jgi:hypothetical protein
MANGSIILDSGKKIIINRAYKATPDYTVPSKFKVGISSGTPNVGDTDLDIAIPIENGTVIDNGSNQLTGSNGGANTTDNTTTYKEGAGESDAKAQNLLTDGLGADATKTWTLTPLTSNFSTTEPFGFWLYIKDTTTYDKLVAAGTALQLRIRTSGDPADQYYYYDRTKAQLSVGWNWITSNTTNVGNLSTGAGGAPSGNLNEFVIEIECANAADEFSAGDVVYDLMRRWSSSDLTNNYVSGYPTIDETNFEVESRGFLSSVQANGFPIDGFALFNTDNPDLAHSKDTFTDESKSSTDQITFIIKDRLI